MHTCSYGVPRTVALTLVVVVVLVASVFGQTTVDQINVGDLVLATGTNGIFQVWRNTGADAKPNYQLLGSFSDSSGSSTGCANDVNWRVYGTLSSTSGSTTTGRLDRFAIPSPHGVTVSTGINDPKVKSVAVDGNGFVYVGGAQINQYVNEVVQSGGTQVQQLTQRATFSPTGGAPYLDLLNNSTLLYTNGGPTIFQLPIPFTTASTLIDTSNLTHPATFFSLKVIPSGTTNAGSILVAAGSSVFRYDPPFSATSTPAMTYSVPGNPTFTSVAVDTNRHSLWAGDSQSGNFYRFDIATGTLETPKGPKALNIGTGTLNGMCLEGGFGAAQPQWTKQTLTATKAANSVNFCIPSVAPATCAPPLTNANVFTATLVGLNANDNVTFYAVDFSRLSPPSPQRLGPVQGAGITDPPGPGVTGPPFNLQCALDDAATGTQCEDYKLELSSPCSTTASNAPCSYLDMQVALANYDLPASTSLGINPRFYGDMASDDTDFVFFDGTSLGGGRSTAFSVQETTTATAVTCGTPFLSPINGGTDPKTGTPTFNGNLGFSLQVAATPADCKAGNFINNLTLRLKQVLQITGGAPQKFGIAVTPSPSGNGFVFPSGCVAGAPSGVSPGQLCDGIFSQPTGNNNAYNIGVSTKGLPTGTYIYTVVDDSQRLGVTPQLPEFSVFITLK